MYPLMQVKLVLFCEQATLATSPNQSFNICCSFAVKINLTFNAYVGAVVIIFLNLEIAEKPTQKSSKF